MIKRQVELIFPTNLIKEPVIYKMSKAVNVVFNIRRAKVTTRIGEIELELEAPDDVTMDQAVQFLTRSGVSVEPITHSTLES
ncbi:MAG TPA: NIL domain-containing protein [Elusimicrobiota bacterium]|nr:NIL domain-containing protein [Elusimicrobiota bacterium]